MPAHGAMSRKRLLAVVVAGSIAITTACGIGAGATPTGAALLVTQGFGVQTLLQSPAPKVSGADTVMRLLERNARVTTRYGGGFVESIDGRSGGTQNGQPDDWFLYVNGVQSGKGAAATKVHDGDHIWWDRHVWAGTENIPAVVGSFPEPFLDGYGGQRYPVHAAEHESLHQRLRRARRPADRRRARLPRLRRVQQVAARSRRSLLDARDRPDRRPVARRPVGERRLRALR